MKTKYVASHREINREELTALIRKIMALPPEPKPTVFVSEIEALILDDLCEHPRSALREIAKRTRLSVNTALRRMNQRGWVRPSNVPKSKLLLWSVTDEGKKAACSPQKWAMKRTGA